MSATTKTSKYRAVYKVTYPNGKIYIGRDYTDDINYWGSPKSEVIARDFTRHERRDMTIRREVLWQKRGATKQECDTKEFEMIRKHRANNPTIGYNRWPKWRGDEAS